MQIRARRSSDIDATTELLREVQVADAYPRTWPPDPRRWLVVEHELSAWISLIDGRVVGHLSLRSTDGQEVWPAWRQASNVEDERLAVVSRFFVKPRSRGAGVGGALLAHAQACAAKRDLRLVLEVAVRQGDAIALYERRGWVRVGAALRPASDGGHPLQVILFIAPGQ